MKKILTTTIAICSLVAATATYAVVSKPSSEQSARCTPYPDCILSIDGPNGPVVKKQQDQ